MPQLWRVKLTVKPVIGSGKRKSRVHDYVVLAETPEEAEKKAVVEYRPQQIESFTVSAESWDGDVVQWRTYLD